MVAPFVTTFRSMMSVDEGCDDPVSSIEKESE
jgi:hypothetical protein